MSPTNESGRKFPGFRLSRKISTASSLASQRRDSLARGNSSHYELDPGNGVEDSRENHSPISVASTRDVPDDILLEITRYLYAPEILVLCLLSHRTTALFMPFLYSCVDLNTRKKWELGISVFKLRPELTHYVKRLSLRPNGLTGWNHIDSHKKIEEGSVLSSISEILGRGGFDSLQEFRWDGWTYPIDTFWTELRNSCPRLTGIGLTVRDNWYRPKTKPGKLPVGYSGLNGFSLELPKYRQPEGSQGTTPISDSFWDMLLIHSPDLREIVLDGANQKYYIWDIRKVFSGKWPNLRSISIGSLAYCDLPTDDNLVSSFLTAHPNLRNVEFQWTTPRTSMFYLPDMPSLYSFHGRSHQLKHAPALPSLRCLHFTDWFSPSARFQEILQPFPNIRSLSIYVNFMDNITPTLCAGLYERVISSCPKLSHLEISSTGPVSLKDFSSALRRAKSLKSFVLTRTRRLSDESLSKSAMRIATQNPNLEYFCIKSVDTWDHHDQLLDKYSLKEFGMYYILRDNLGKPHSLRMHEQSRFSSATRTQVLSI
ncbi:hypothetical protein BD779DRAFT_1668330 [Infundibulicybe gibba]|nr:hypothetical protein BD779DRAFT_1668330 [Infundibulicybe gibba]